MALDRQTIEKRDFPIGRRGYEPASVDAHLANVASEVEALQRTQSDVAGTASSGAYDVASLASVASTQVQIIVEAAESTAAAIERDAREQAAQVEHDAREQAARLEQDAERESQRVRDEAMARSQQHIGQVQEATSLMLQRVDAMESELGTLVDSLRTGANRVAADLYLVSTTMSDLQGAVGVSEAGASPPPVAPEVPTEPAEAAPPEPAVEPPAARRPETEPAPKARPAPEPAPATAAGDEDVEGARLIALNMALNGQTREETDRYLADNFELSDRAGLLDEVYATVEG